MAVRGRSNADGALIVALAQGHTVAEAAEAAGVAERTVYRRRSDPEFRLQVDQARQAIVDRALGILADGMVDAAHTVRMVATEGSPALQLQASLALLDRYSRLRDEHRNRASALEAEASRLRVEAGKVTMEQAIDMLTEAALNDEQAARVWRLIETGMDRSTRRRFDAWIEQERARIDWEDHRPSWATHNRSK
jgi:hypothetical protein